MISDEIFEGFLRYKGDTAPISEKGAIGSSRKGYFRLMESRSVESAKEKKIFPAGSRPFTEIAYIVSIPELNRLMRITLPAARYLVTLFKRITDKDLRFSEPFQGQFDHFLNGKVIFFCKDLPDHLIYV
jgi:hypothetical protein